jgi:pyridoxal 5'-phosphate synthase pdxS subunit
VAHAIVKAVTNYQDAAILAEVSRGLGQPMSGIAVGAMAEGDKLAKRGW